MRIAILAAILAAASQTSQAAPEKALQKPITETAMKATEVATPKYEFKVKVRDGINLTTETSIHAVIPSINPISLGRADGMSVCKIVDGDRESSLGTNAEFLIDMVLMPYALKQDSINVYVSISDHTAEEGQKIKLLDGCEVWTGRGKADAISVDLHLTPGKPKTFMMESGREVEVTAFPAPK